MSINMSEQEQKTLSEVNHEKRKERRKKSAEDFTPLSLVNQMLDKMEEYTPDIFTNPEKTIIDPSCGNGNMLIEVLKRKLKHANPVQAISTIYGCDIFRDNVNECRLRLLKVITKYKTVKLSQQDYIEIIKQLAKNIVHVPLTQYQNGSLDYLKLPKGETFNNYLSEARCLETIKKIKDGKLLDGLKIE